jgi:hypothetical protein
MFISKDVHTCGFGTIITYIHGIRKITKISVRIFGLPDKF